MLFVRSMICFLAMDNVNRRYVMAGDAENIRTFGRFNNVAGIAGV